MNKLALLAMASQTMTISDSSELIYPDVISPDDICITLSDSARTFMGAMHSIGIQTDISTYQLAMRDMGLLSNNAIIA